MMLDDSISEEDNKAGKQKKRSNKFSRKDDYASSSEDE